MRATSLFLAALVVAGPACLAGAFDRSEWLPRYPALVRWISSLPGKSWGMTLGEDSTDPEEKGSFTVSVEPTGAVSVTSRYKAPAIDGDSHKRLPGVLIDVVVKIRDTNHDGAPDEFRPEPFHPDKGEAVAPDGFLVIRPVDHFAIVMQWDTCIGYAVRTMPPETAPRAK